jgi:5-formyltetrahydrofolate cyclo-ligase
LYELGCSSGRSARLFPGERDGRRLAHGNGQADRLLQGSYERGRVAAVGTLVKVGIHHIAVTVQAAGR